MMHYPECHRHSIRLPEYDYSGEGFYFVTICTRNRECLLGKIVDGEMILSKAGQIIAEWYLKIPEKYSHVSCWDYVIMPNHFHCIIQINDDDFVGAGFACPLRSGEDRAGNPRPYRPTLGQIIGYFKYQTTQSVNCPNKRLWQRNYYEHIIRNQQSYNLISEYIQTNPLRWQEDTLFVE